MAAQSILAMVRDQLCKPLTVVPAAEADFRHLDLQAYARFRADMEARGFVALGDVEVLELSNSPTALHTRPMLRYVLSGDGRVLGEYYQLKPRVGRRIVFLLRGLAHLRLIDAPRDFATGMRTHHVVAFESELDDGAYLVTANTQAVSLFSNPPTVESRYLPLETPVAVLLATHVARLTEIANERGTRAVVMRTLQDTLAMQHRQQAARSSYRAALGWITREELERMSSVSSISEAVYAEIQALLAEERAAT